MRGVGRPVGSRDKHGRALPVLSLGYARDKAAMHVGDAIRAARERVDVSAEELAGRLEVCTATVLAWEAGRKIPPVAQLLRVAWALGVRVAELVEEVA